MAGAGGGKMRPKRLHGASKPYQRSRPKSILERVKDFVTPSWLSNLWTTESEDNRPPSRAYSTRLPTSTANSIPLQPGLPDGPYFGLRDIDSQTGNSAETTHTEWQRFRSPAFKPDDVNTPVLTSHEGLSVPVSTSTPIELDEDVVVVDAGEGPPTQRDDTSAPPSVVSSLYPNLDKLEHQQMLSESNLRQLTDLGHRQSSTPSSLWSHTPSGRSVTTRARPASPFNRPQQPAITTRRPSFNTSYFGTPRGSLGTTSRTEPSTSPFYPGRTAYGGASAQRSTNKRVRTSPYEVHLPIKRSVRPRLAKPADETDIGITSNTAKRILDTLERMSTPLSDAKRIPLSPSASPMAFSVTRTPKPRQPASSRKPFGPMTRGIRLAGPPVSGLSIPRSVSIAPNTQPPIPSLAPTTSQDTPGDDVTETPASVEPSTSISSGFFFKPLSTSTTLTQAPPLSRLDTTPTQPSSMQRPGSNGSSGGKMKHKRSTGHYSANKDAEDDVVEVSELPNVPLPITTLPSFSFGKSIQPPKSSSEVTVPSTSVNWAPSVSKAFSFTTSTPAVRAPTADKEPEFTFASPILKQTSTISAPEFETTEAFTFRIPKKADLSVSPNAPPTSVVIPSSTRSSYEPPAAPSATSRDTEEENDEEETGYGIKVAKTLRTGSCLEVFGLVPSSEPSEEPKPVASEAPADDIFAKFRPPAGSWKCGTCMLQNKPTAATCIACQAENPPKASKNNPQTELTAASSKTMESSNNTGSAPSVDDMLAKFRPPPGSWKCSTCLLQNKKEASKCIACESPNPAEKQKTAAPPAPTNDSLFEKFRPPPGSWKCETCLLQNKADANTCIACAAPKPNTNSGSSNPTSSVNNMTLMNSTDSTNSTKVDNFMDKFKPPPGSWKCDTCLIQNKETAERCIACETPKPGSQPTLKTPPASAFKFGGQSTGNFKFGGNSESTNKFQAPGPSLPMEGFKFGSGGIQFGAPKDKTTSELKLGGDSTVKTNSLGQDGKTLFGSDKTGSTESGFKFGASSVPSEEKDKPTLGSGFQFGSATTKSDSAPPNVDPFKSTAPSQATFNFGGSAVNAVTAETQDKDSISEPKGFSFGSTQNDTQSSTLGSLTTEQNQSGMKFSFGAKTQVENTNQPALASQTPFKFGAGSVAPVTTAPQTVEKPVYKFGADSVDTTKSANKTSGFSFGTPAENAVSTAAQLPHQNSVVPTFNFGKSDAGTDEAGTGQPLAKKSVKFALPIEEASFGFGGPPPQKTPQQVSPFVFGATDNKVDAPSKPNGSITFGTAQSGAPAPFTFGAAANNSKPGGFSFSATTNQNSAPAVAGSFQFGTTTNTTVSTPTQQNMLSFGSGGFGSTTSAPSPTFGAGFGSRPTANSSPNPFSAQQPIQTTTPAFGAPTGTSVFGGTPTPSFGATNSQTSTPTFGVSATGSAPGFGNTGSAFGASAMNSAAGFKPEASPAYNFGGTATTGSSPGVFAFGANNAQNPAPQAPSVGGFNFGQQQRAAPGFGSQNATGASSPSVFQFGGNQQQQQQQPQLQSQGQNASFSLGAGNTQNRRIKKAVRRTKPRP